MLSVLDLLQPGEEALVLKDSHDFDPGKGEVGDWFLDAAHVARVDCIIVYAPDLTGAELWRGKLVDTVPLANGKKKLRLTELRRMGHTTLIFSAFVGGPDGRGRRYVRR